MSIASAAAGLLAVRNKLIVNLATKGVDVAAGLTFMQEVDLILTIEEGSGPIVNNVTDGGDLVTDGGIQVTDLSFT